MPTGIWLPYKIEKFAATLSLAKKRRTLVSNTDYLVISKWEINAS